MWCCSGAKLGVPPFFVAIPPLRFDSPHLHRFPPIVAIAAICASAGYAVGATERPRPLEGFASGGRGLLVSDSDVGRDLARRVWDERERRPLRESQEKILDDALELMAPAERRSVASPHLVEVECCRLQVLLEARAAARVPFSSRRTPV